jgi:2-dehydropantoate 2-reductase
MQVLIHGAGAVGLGLGSFLLGAGASVAFVGRAATVEALARRGLERGGRFGAQRAAPDDFEAAERVGALAPRGFDFVLIAAKSFDSETVARELAGARGTLGERPLFVVCQNGWGSAEIFAEALGREGVYGARIITGFVRPEPHRVEVTAHAEPVAIGSLFGGDPQRAEPLCAALRRGGLPAETTDRLAELLWAKLLYNNCLNALGALCGVPYGVLAESEETRSLMEQVAEETFCVMRAAGYRTRYPDAGAFLSALYAELLPPTARHESSTLQDLRAGRRTEIDALNGALLRAAAALGIATPYNEALVALLKGRELHQMRRVHEPDLDYAAWEARIARGEEN